MPPVRRRSSSVGLWSIVVVLLLLWLYLQAMRPRYSTVGMNGAADAPMRSSRYVDPLEVVPTVPPRATRPAGSPEPPKLIPKLHLREKAQRLTHEHHTLSPDKWAELQLKRQELIKALAENTRGENLLEAAERMREKYMRKNLTANVFDGVVMRDIDGREVRLNQYTNKVVLIVNVASRCGFTAVNYDELPKMYDKFKSRSFEILFFPCNQFGGQEPGSPAEIKKFAMEKGVTFPVMEKVVVNGPNSHPLYHHLRTLTGVEKIEWNFGKFLLGKGGVPLHYYAHDFAIDRLAKQVDALLTVEASHAVLDVEVETLAGEKRNLKRAYDDDVVLIVNVASQCGFTAVNYNELPKVYDKFKSRGFKILFFPCNQFGGQEPGSPAEIKKFAAGKGVTFPMMQKVDVNGPNAHPLFKALKQATGVEKIEWNFGKFLVARDGSVRYYQHDFPIDRLAVDIDALLKAPPLRSILKRVSSDHELVVCDTTVGPLVVEVREDWAPIGAMRFKELVNVGFFTDMAFFRVPPPTINPIAQYGVARTRKMRAVVEALPTVVDDHPTRKEGVLWNEKGNRMAQQKGHFGFGGSGNNSRSYHMWIARKTFSEVHPDLGRNVWDVPVARVINEEGLSALDKIGEVGDMAPWGSGPDTAKMVQDPTFESQFPGDYVRQNFPDLSYFKSCRLIGKRDAW